MTSHKTERIDIELKSTGSSTEFTAIPSMTFDEYISSFTLDKTSEDATRDQCRVPNYVKEFAQLQQSEYKSKKRIESAMAAFGFKCLRDIEDVDAQVFNEKNASHLRKKAEGDYSAQLAGFQPEEPTLPRWSSDIWLPESMHRDITRIADFLGTDKSVVMRHCMYIAIYFYDDDVVSGDKWTNWQGKARRAYERLRDDIETRTEHYD